MAHHLIRRRWRCVGVGVARATLTGACLVTATVFAPSVLLAAPLQEPGVDSSGDSATRLVRIRPQDGTARAIVTDARRLSPSVVCLLERLEDTDLIVYVQSADGLPWPTGEIRVLTVTPADRVLLIRLERVRRRSEQIAFLAHELQHAMEIAADPEVVDAETLAALYRRIGLRTVLPDHYETSAALKVEQEVTREVYESRHAAASR